MKRVSPSNNMQGTLSEQSDFDLTIMKYNKIIITLFEKLLGHYVQLEQDICCPLYMLNYYSPSPRCFIFNNLITKSQDAFGSCIHTEDRYIILHTSLD